MGLEFGMCTGATDKGCSYCGHRGCYCRCPGGKRQIEKTDPEYGKDDYDRDPQYSDQERLRVAKVISHHEAGLLSRLPESTERFMARKKDV